MIFAVLQGDDYRVAIENLNAKGFYATVLHSTGGFLNKKSVTPTMTTWRKLWQS
ncbi:MAG: hypothetical protein SPE19_11435 [Candidatus Faecousia sp.]|nr:hypothetical protein [Candidatus Faecousia sp.]